MRRNVSDDGDMFKETKLLLYFRIENHGCVTKTDITYAKQIIFAVISETFLLFNSVNTSKSKKLSAKPNSFWELGSRVPPLFPALPLRGGWGKKIDFFFASKFLFSIYKKSQKVSNQYINAFWSNRQFRYL